MLGRNCGCSWWFEVRRDWPRVTLNKYTRTSQEGVGRLRLPPNHPWLISQQIQGDFLCTLPTTTIPSPNLPPLPPPPKPWKVMESGRHRQGNPGSPADGALPRNPALQQAYLVLINTHIYTQKDIHKYNCRQHLPSSSDQLLNLWSLTKVTESPIFQTAVEAEHMVCCHTVWSQISE